ncbi:hypothetical protein ACHAWF_004588 [Thalassiosira exigua]
MFPPPAGGGADRAPLEASPARRRTPPPIPMPQRIGVQQQHYHANEMHGQRADGSPAGHSSYVHQPRTDGAAMAPLFSPRGETTAGLPMAQPQSQHLQYGANATYNSAHHLSQAPDTRTSVATEAAPPTVPSPLDTGNMAACPPMIDTRPEFPQPQPHGVTFSPSTGKSWSLSSSSGGAPRYQLEVASDSPVPQPLSFSSGGTPSPGHSSVGHSSPAHSSQQGIHGGGADLPRPMKVVTKSLIRSSTEDSSTLTGMEASPRSGNGDVGGATLFPSSGDLLPPGRSDGHDAVTPRVDNTAAGGTMWGDLAAAAVDAEEEAASPRQQTQQERWQQRQRQRRRRQSYETFSNVDMLPPPSSREDVLYYPLDGPHELASRSDEDEGREGPPPSSCCDRDRDRDYAAARRNLKRQRRPPDYLQLYVKCERSEPFDNDELDLVTWYRDSMERVTADRTLVVRGTANLVQLVRGIVEAFGLSSSASSSAPAQPSDGRAGVRSWAKSGEDGRDDDDDAENLVGAYRDVCFVSDVKMSTCRETAATRLTPLPIPGMRYKYVDRGKDVLEGEGGRETSSVLSTDPEGMKRTLASQLLDEPVYARSPSSAAHGPRRRGARTRLAMVYCAPKRKSCVSSRSAMRGTMPPTIYHFQILLEGSVGEEDLPSSFAGQATARCVGATGGVAGGNVVDAPGEVDDLNRALWDLAGDGGTGSSEGGGGRREVVGLASPGPDRRDDLEQILGDLRVPLFDVRGNRTPRELVVDRVLYDLRSGKISMEVAKRTQRAAEAIEGTAEWLARRAEDFARGVAEGATACEDRYLARAFESEGLREFDRAVSRLGIGNGDGGGRKSIWI